MLRRYHDKLGWYRHRLAAMSWAEIRWRAREAADRRVAKHALVWRTQPVLDRGLLPAIPGIRERLLAWDVPPRLLEAWTSLARDAEAGAFVLLSQRWPPRPLNERWHYDPVTGGSWPSHVYCFDIDYRHQRLLGDVKYVWELNRLQYLPLIAALALKTRDEEQARLCAAHLASWIDANPCGTGVAWASGIELALRAVSIIATATFVGEHFTGEERARLWATLQAHGAWLEKFPSRFSSANNHRVAEATGLLLIGALCPALPQSARWRDLGWGILCDATLEQIHPDGVGAEQSVSYTAFVVELLLLGLLLARAAEIPIPRQFMARLAKAGEYLRWFTDSSGNQPRIGDDDSGRVFNTFRADEAYGSSILSCTAAMLGRADLTPPGAEPDFRQLVFGFPPPAASQPRGHKLFARGGYTVGHHVAASREVMVVFDHGHLGYLSIAAHGHADALSVWLHLDGQPVLVDAGTYLYHSGGRWRQHFRGTAAHNTLSVQGMDASVMAGNFNWSLMARARLIEGCIDKDGWWLEAEHDGYLRRFGAIHRRSLSVDIRHGCLSIRDRIDSRRPLKVEVGFLLHPSLQATQAGDAVLVFRDRERLLEVSSEGPLAVSVADATVPGGWYSPTFGTKYPTTRLTCRGMLDPHQEHVTFLKLAATRPVAPAPGQVVGTAAMGSHQ